MTKQISPEALKTLRRASKHKTRKQLAFASNVSQQTIKRIESGKDSYRASDGVADALAKALGVTIEDLSKIPSETGNHEETLREFGYRPLRTMIDAETALAFNMVQHIYGISIRSQIEMAPLFMTLLAEGSLAWRRKRVEAIEEAADRLLSLGGGHFSFVNAASRTQDGAAAEHACIKNRDLFGDHVAEDTFDLGFDPSANNPFADYLQEFTKEVNAKAIIFNIPFSRKTSEGFPEYRIGADIIEQLTGNNPRAEYALLRAHVRLKDIPEELRSDDKEAERVAWMIAQIPAEELAVLEAERERRMALAASLDWGDGTPLLDKHEGGDHG